MNIRVTLALLATASIAMAEPRSYYIAEPQIVKQMPTSDAKTQEVIIIEDLNNQKDPKTDPTISTIIEQLQKIQSSSAQIKKRGFQKQAFQDDIADIIQRLSEL